MTFSTINIGSVANDGTGDPIRTAFEKVNTGLGSLDSQAYFNSRLTRSNIFVANTLTLSDAAFSGNLSASTLSVTTFSPTTLTAVGNVTAGNLIVPPGGFIYGTFAGTISAGDIEATNIGLDVPAAAKFTTLTATTQILVTGTEQSANLATGAVRIAGGMAVNANVSVGGNITVDGNIAVGNIAIAGQVDGNIRLYGGTVYINDVPVTTALENFSGGNVAQSTRFLSTAISTRANTGAVIVEGGLGVIGNLYAGSNVGISSELTVKYVSVASNVLVGPSSNVGLYSNGAIKGSLISGVQSGITTIGTLNSLNLNGNLTLASGGIYRIGEPGSVLADVFSFRVNATQITGTLQTASQTNITAVGILNALDVAGNVVAGNVQADKGTFTQVAGTVLTAAQPNITSLGTIATLAAGTVTVSGNISAARLAVTSGISTDTGANIVMAAGTYIGTAATAGVRVPHGTESQRPSATTANVGMMRLNTSTGQFEGFNGTAWVGFSTQVSAVGGGNDKVFQENQGIITTSYTLSTGTSAMSVGPITLAAGVVITIPAGKRWVIL